MDALLTILGLRHLRRDSPSITVWMPFSPGSDYDTPIWAAIASFPVQTDAHNSFWNKLFRIGREEEGEKEKYLVFKNPI